MRRTPSVVSASFVARESGYRATGGWAHAERDCNAAFAPPETYRARLDALLGEIAALGFTGVDLWQGHLNHAWATPGHVLAARELLDAYGLEVTSLSGWMGSTADELAAACRLAAAVGTRVLGGGTSVLRRDRAAAEAVLRDHGVVLAWENHAERTPAEVLDLVGDGAGGHVAATVDTGWWGTQGYPAPDAIRALGAHVAHVHLKDVHPGEEHETCGFGDGVVALEECVEALREVGYTGAVSVEHEPYRADPTEDLRRSRALLERWLVSAG